MPRPLIGAAPMTATERSARRRQLETARLDAALRDLLATAERGTIGAKYVAAKCREALDHPR
jgi:hypothetical protein